MPGVKIGENAILDFMRMNDDYSVTHGRVYALNDGAIRHELPDGYSLTYEGDGIVRVKFDKLESRAYDDHAFYAHGYAGKLLPRRFLELYKHEIAVGHVQREDE